MPLQKQFILLSLPSLGKNFFRESSSIFSTVSSLNHQIIKSLLQGCHHERHSSSMAYFHLLLQSRVYIVISLTFYSLKLLCEVGYHYFHFANEEIGSELLSGLTQVTEFAGALMRPEPSIPATHLVSCPMCRAEFI